MPEVRNITPKTFKTPPTHNTYFVSQRIYKDWFDKVNDSCSNIIMVDVSV